MAATAGFGTVATRIDGDLVFLSIDQDAYFFVLTDSEGALAGDERMLTPDQIDALAAAGLSPDVLVGFGPRPGEKKLWRDLPRHGRPPSLRYRDLHAFVAAQRMATRLLAADRLTPALELARRLPRHPRPSDPTILPVQVARFEAMAIWLPRARECVATSLALLLFLSRFGVAADWVFGVHLFPFRAHCWLAAGDYVIGDASHRLLAYTPILTVAAAAT